MRLLLLHFLSLRVGGGGGGGDGNTSQPQTNTPTRVAPFVNINTALASILQLQTTYSSLPSNDGSLYKANLIIGNDEVYPFVSKGNSINVTVSKRFQIQIDDESGRLVRQYIWKLHLDASGNPVGLASSDELFTWSNRLCMNSNSFSVLPKSTNSSGSYFSGDSGSYYEQFRSGTYAHYCDTSVSSATKAVTWSIADGDPSPYACIVLPDMWGPKTQICFVTNVNGALSDKPWIRTFRSDGTIATDYKDTTVNKPYQVFSSQIDPSNYWYGQVWRPSDGSVIKTYEGTQFSSEYACREQKQIDWKSVYSAVNVAWSCVNVVRR